MKNKKMRKTKRDVAVGVIAAAFGNTVVGSMGVWAFAKNATLALDALGKERVLLVTEEVHFAGLARRALAKREYDAAARYAIDCDRAKVMIELIDRHVATLTAGAQGTSKKTA